MKLNNGVRDHLDKRDTFEAVLANNFLETKLVEEKFNESLADVILFMIIHLRK